MGPDESSSLGAGINVEDVYRLTQLNEQNWPLKPLYKGDTQYVNLRLPKKYPRASATKSMYYESRYLPSLKDRLGSSNMGVFSDKSRPSTPSKSANNNIPRGSFYPSDNQEPILSDEEKNELITTW